MIEGRDIPLQKLDGQMTLEIEKKKWHVSDVVVAIIICLGTGALMYAGLRRLSFIHINLADGIAILGGTLVSIYLLNQKYPIMLFSPFNIGFTFIYSLKALFICLLIYMPFYHHIWTGGLEDLPSEYTIFAKFNLIEKTIYLLYLCRLAPATEELLSRGFIYRILKNRYTILWGTIISTTVFYVFHLGDPENLMNIKLILVSLVFTYTYEKTGTIWSSIITHSLNI